jgi:hypothetical protein
MMILISELIDFDLKTAKSIKGAVIVFLNSLLNKFFVMESQE